MNADKKMDGVAILCGEPLIGCSPTDIRQWMQEMGHTDSVIAEAMAAVGQKVGWLRHELNDPDNSDAQIEEYHKEFEVWRDLEKKLVEEIICNLKKQNRTAGTNHVTEGKGWHSIIEPFMEQNGFRDGAGWWVRKGVRNDTGFVVPFTGSAL